MMYTIPKSVYHCNLNSQALYHHFTPQSDVRERFSSAIGHVAEALVVSPHVTLDISNDISYVNLPLALLVDYFGFDVVRELLREGALRFLFRTSHVQLSTRGSGSHHFLGLEAETGLDDKSYDAERFAREAFSTLDVRSDSLSDERIGELAKLAAGVTVFTRRQTADEAVQLALRALEQSDFAFQGKVISGDPFGKIHDKHRKWALQVANDFLVASVVREYELDFFEEEASWKALIDVVNTVRNSELVLQATEKVLKIERVPSVPALMKDGILKPADVLRLRHAAGTQEFRRWLWSRPDPLNSEEVLEAYRSLLIGGRTEVVPERWFRAVKVVLLELLGATIEIGTRLGGEAASIPGAQSEIAAKMLRGGSAYVAECLFEKLVRPGNPRGFADELRRLEVERSTISFSGPQLFRTA
jgi:hypothetical protein